MAPPPHRLGIVGTGFIARGFALAASAHLEFRLSKVLTRRNIPTCTDFPRQELLTNSLHELIEHSDIVLEATGDPVYATAMIEQVLGADLPVVTMDSELQVTTGSYLVSKGLISEAEGDQPGCLAALRENCLAMGFTPLVYGNLKGFLNHNPSKRDMTFWAKKQGISLQQVTSFTDGTKIQIEQALVANAFGAGIARNGLLGMETTDLDASAKTLAERAQRVGTPICDYLRSPNFPPGVFICATHTAEQQPYLKYLKLGNGPFYMMLQGWHLCHLEIAKTIKRVLSGGGVLLNNSACPSISVAAIAKKPLIRGQLIDKGIGGFDVRGEAIRIREYPDLVPIGLMGGAVLKSDISPGQRISLEDVEVPDSVAYRAWLQIRDRVIATPLNALGDTPSV